MGSAADTHNPKINMLEQKEVENLVEMLPIIPLIESAIFVQRMERLQTSLSTSAALI